MDNRIVPFNFTTTYYKTQNVLDTVAHSVRHSSSSSTARNGRLHTCSVESEGGCIPSNKQRKGVIHFNLSLGKSLGLHQILWEVIIIICLAYSSVGVVSSQAMLWSQHLVGGAQHVATQKRLRGGYGGRRVWESLPLTLHEVHFFKCAQCRRIKAANPFFSWSRQCIKRLSLGRYVLSCSKRMHSIEAI